VSADRNASSLCADDIGAIVVFSWAFPSGVVARVTGELRQVSHDGNGTAVDLTSPVDRDGGLEQFELPHTAAVTIQ
jgi:hypothetical protein